MKTLIKKFVPYELYSAIQDFVNYFRSFRYMGSEYRCPMCNTSFRRFLPTGLRHEVIQNSGIVGAGYRSNAVCPRCLSSDRERLVYLYLRTRKPYVFTNTLRVLHVAPEKSLANIFSRQKNIEYLTVDLELPSAKERMDITDIRYDDNEFDIIICNHVLEHIPADTKAMSELFRVMKPGGFGILQVPISYTIAKTYEDPNITSDEDRIKYYGQADHVRLYGVDYFDRLAGVGFGYETIDLSDDFSLEEFSSYSLIAEERIFAVTK